MNEKRPKGSSRHHAWGALLILVLATWLWTSGLLGHALSRWVLPRVPPFTLGQVFSWRKAGFQRPAPPLEAGVTLLIHSHRLEAILQEAVPLLRWLLPPGVLRDGVWVLTVWTPRQGTGHTGIAWPICLAIRDADGNPPRLRVVYPIREINRLLHEAYGDRLTKEGEWLFGTYERTYRITFDEARMVTETPATVPRRPKGMSLRLTARGRLRILFRDDPLKATLTGRVRRLEGRIDLRPVQSESGVHLRYEVRVETLDLDVQGLLPWGDEKLGETLRRSLEEAWNKPKKKQKIEAKTWPRWFPWDTQVEIVLK